MPKITYLVREGVDWINGARVPEDRKVRLTATEALHDFSLGRLEEVRTAKAKRPAASDD